MADPTLEFDPGRIRRQSEVRRVELHAELPSTSDLALELAATAPAADLPLLVLAVRQTGGRGRGDHRWWATAGALTFSLVLDTEAWRLVPRQWPRISLATGIAVANTIQGQLPAGRAQSASPHSHDVRVKWPNDVFLSGRKICGILAENGARQPHRLVIGIGLNVNNSWRDSPPELQTVGTSLMDVAGRRCSPQAILLELLQRLHQSLTQVADDTFPLTESWRALCMLEGNTVTVAAGNRRTTGVCQGIDEDGALLLHNECGIQRCVAGSVASIQ